MFHAFVLNHVFSYVCLFCFVFYFACLFIFCEFFYCFFFFCLHYHKNEWQHKPIQYKKSLQIPKWVTRIRKSKKDRQHHGQKKKDKRTNNELQINKQKTKGRVTRTPLKHPDDLRCSGRVCSSCSTSGTRRDAPYSVIRHGWGKDRKVLTTSGTYQWSFVTHIFCNSKVHLLDYQIIVERRPTKLWINDILNNKTAS